MTKEVVRKVFISCACFLLLVSIAAHYLQQNEAEMVSSEADQKVMYLTFDDGPSKNTQKVLDVLDKYQVKATFFVTAQNKEYLDYIKKESEAGHQIGVHSYSHEFKNIYASVNSFFDDIQKMNDVIREQTGSESKVLRFPGGTSNTVSRKYCDGIMSSLSEMVTQKGYRYYDWNASNGDGECGTNPDALVNQAIKEAGDKQEVIMLMHDGSCNTGTPEALGKLIEAFQEKGYEFKVVDATTTTIHHQIAN